MGLNALLDSLLSLLNLKLFELNQTPITVTSILMFIIVLVGFAVVSRLFRRLFLRRLLVRMGLDEGTRYNFLRITHYCIMLIGCLVAFQFIGIDLSGLVVVLGLLSVGIGFGLQNITSNFVAGLILLLERPISVGDRVTIGDIEGDVAEINMRSTTIRSLNNISIIVPNSDFISSQVVNWSHKDLKVRLDIDVGVSYDSDLEVVTQSLLEVAQEIPQVLQTPPPEVLLLSFGDSAWDMQLQVWIADPKAHPKVRSAINCAIVLKFRQNNVEIPYPQQDLHVRSPLPLPFQDQWRNGD